MNSKLKLVIRLPTKYGDEPKIWRGTEGEETEETKETEEMQR